jgi:hypothetical protein
MRTFSGDATELVSPEGAVILALIFAPVFA